MCTSMNIKYELLLSRVSRLYERHQATRHDRAKFNLFTVLRNSRDEVNLHSRFLHALLDYQDPEVGKRQNLEDFVREVACVSAFQFEGATVGRESDNIDLLISNGQQAVVVENKIDARDQDRQLIRYRDKLIARNYRDQDIHLIYLTLDGSAPSDQSIGDLKCESISYRNDLPRWLEWCQQRAVDDPALRESIAQYLHLIRDLTGTNYSEEYMTELKQLCLLDDNMILAHDLSEALLEAKVDLIVRLWNDINDALTKAIPDLPELDPEYADLAHSVSVRKYIEHKRGSQSALYYRFAEHAWLSVVAADGLWFGVDCTKADNLDLHEKLRIALTGVGGGRADISSPWYRYPDGNPDFRNLNHDSLRMLMSDETRAEFVSAISRSMADVWQQIKLSGLAD